MPRRERQDAKPLRVAHGASPCWTVFDVFTGQPVELKHQLVVAMTAFADATVERLNSRDARRRPKRTTVLSNRPVGGSRTV
jgi:hypothetical protein